MTREQEYLASYYGFTDSDIDYCMNEARKTEAIAPWKEQENTADCDGWLTFIMRYHGKVLEHHYGMYCAERGED